MSDHPEVETIARLMELAALYGLEELEVEEAGLKVHLHAREQRAGDEEALAEGAYLWPPPIWNPPAGAPVRPATALPLLAPLTGTFYRAPNPDSLPYVQVGDTVEEGQPVGIIEAMKVYSEIKTDRAGVVIEVVAANARIIQHGDVLMYIDPAG